MKKIIIYSVLMALSFSCVLSASDNKIKGSGKVTMEQRTVSSFEKIDIDGVFQVYLSQGNEEKAEVEIDDNLQQYVILVNDGRTLKLSIQKGINFNKTTKNNVYITFKDISELDIDGVCNVESRTPIKCDRLKVEHDGVGSSKMEVECNRLEIEQDGVGGMEFYGKATEFIVRKGGVGKLKADKLDAEIVDIRNSGVGSAEVYASKELSLNNSGVGSIKYSGNAVIKSLKSDGIGKISKKD